MEGRLDFSIITPSFNMLDDLKRCCASIADQEGVTLEHIVVDGGSKDGTVEWLAQNPQVKSISETDNGMYDAINKGIGMSQGRIVAYLNCDEQYLPGAMKVVKQCSETRPEAHVIFGDTLITNPAGDLIAFRKAYTPRWFYISSAYLYVLSCSLFMHRRIFDGGLLFDANLTSVGDAEFLTRVLRRGFRFFHAKRYLAAFTLSGRNDCTSPRAEKEKRMLLGCMPAWVRLLSGPLNVARLGEKALSGAYFEKFPLSYEIFAGDKLGNRTRFVADKASFTLAGWI